MKPTPHVCPTCKADPDGYYGRLVFPDEVPPAMCPYHPKVALVPILLLKPYTFVQSWRTDDTSLTI
jgi:hypothetical protein